MTTHRQTLKSTSAVTENRSIGEEALYSDALIWV